MKIVELTQPSVAKWTQHANDQEGQIPTADLEARSSAYPFPVPNKKWMYIRREHKQAQIYLEGVLASSYYSKCETPFSSGCVFTWFNKRNSYNEELATRDLKN